LVVPNFLIRDPQIFNKCRIDKIWVLNDEIIVDIFPRLEPRRTPKRDVSLSDLVEEWALRRGRIFKTEVQKADFGMLDFGR
jgi:hypothetical protein